jgi:hypothetical protein
MLPDQIEQIAALLAQMEADHAWEVARKRYHNLLL